MTRYEDTDELATLVALIYFAERRGRVRLGLSDADAADLGTAWCELSADGTLLPSRRAQTEEVATRDDLIAQLAASFDALLEASPTLVDALRVTRARDSVRMLLSAAA